MNLAKAKFTPRLPGRKLECLKIILGAKPPCSRQIKEALITATIIQPPDWNLSFEIICDASDYAIGEVLAQGNYATTEKELLVVENNQRAMEVDKDYTSKDEASDDEDFDDGGGDGGGSSDVDLSD
ncbi:hypothetical protein AgCh_019482 [Apium graveolens]